MSKRLFDAIVEANHRAVAGDTTAGLRVADFEEALPIVALTCVDPRLNALFPNVLGVPAEQFVWLRNAGNIITGPLSSTMRSLALACAVKNAREIAIIGHTDCRVGRMTTMQLLERLKALGIERQFLPENINEFFGMFGSENQNVIKACDIARRSPVIGPAIPVHGLVVNVETGRLDWIVNGYQTFSEAVTKWNEFVHSAGETVDALKEFTEFNIGEMKFPETKIGEAVGSAHDWLAERIAALKVTEEKLKSVPSPVKNVAERVAELAAKHWPSDAEPPPPPPPPPKHPIPPRPRMPVRRGGK